MFKPLLLLLASLFLLLSFACRQGPAEVQIPIAIQFVDGEQAAALIAEDSTEGYFNNWSMADARLQMGLPDSLSIDLGEYQAWLSGLPQVWPSALKSKLEMIWREVLSDCYRLYPQLDLQNISLILTNDQPYGRSIYFTRQNAVICPMSDLQRSSNEEVEKVMQHELFHLISRKHQNLREEAYSFVNFLPAPDSLKWPGELFGRRLLNPDAPFPDYALQHEGKLFVPLVYAAQSPYNPDSPDHFAEQLRFNYFQLEGDSLSPPVLPIAEVVKQTGGLTNYILHPEEILADHFVLLMQQGGPGDNPYLQQLHQLLLKN